MGRCIVHSCSQFSLKTCSTPVWLCLLSLFQVFAVVIHQFFKSVFSKETNTPWNGVFFVHIFYTEEPRRNLWRIPSRHGRFFFSSNQSQFSVGWVVVGFVVGWIWIKPRLGAWGKRFGPFYEGLHQHSFELTKTQPNFVWGGVRDVRLIGKIKYIKSSNWSQFCKWSVMKCPMRVQIPGVSFFRMFSLGLIGGVAAIAQMDGWNWRPTPFEHDTTTEHLDFWGKMMPSRKKMWLMEETTCME